MEHTVDSLEPDRHDRYVQTCRDLADAWTEPTDLTRILGANTCVTIT
jgi:hypothetical protein